MMRTDPSARTTKAPRATAPSNATASGSVPDQKRKVTFTSPRFWNTNTSVTASTARAGSTRIHAFEARVEGIVLEVGAAGILSDAGFSIRNYSGLSSTR